MMGNRDHARDDLARLLRALDALAADIDAIERRPHFLLRRSDISGGIEGFVDHFAIAVRQSRGSGDVLRAKSLTGERSRS
jgi:hypothetical protein